MPPRAPVPPVIHPRVGFTVCGSPESTGVSWELAALIRSKLAEIGCEDLLSYCPPMTYLDAVTYLGAEWETDEPFGEDYLFEDRAGTKVRCTRNGHNRPITLSTVESRAQDILCGRWELNGETGVIGRDASVLNFQHTCVALILAWQDWGIRLDPATQKRVWLTRWPEAEYPDGPTIEKCVVHGIDTSDRVVNTIDTARPRTLSDVLYRCPYFAGLPKKSPDRCDRTTAARVAADAIKVVWNRTGMYLTNFGPTLTHAEACAWIDNHGGAKSRLLESVRHVLEHNRGGEISRHVRLGYAAAILFLMGQSATEEKRVGKYYSSDPREGKHLQWDRWDRAKQFWSEFATSKLPVLTDVLDAEAELEESPESGPRGRQRDYAIVGAWRAYRTGGEVDARACKVRYTRPDAHGVRHLDWSGDEKSVGGIDLGADRIAPDPTDDAEPEPDARSGATDKRYVESVARAPVTSVAASGVLSLLDLVRAEHPEFGCVLLRTPTGGYAAWGPEIGAVQPYTTKPARFHPRGLECVVFRADETEVLVENLTADGVTVALVVEAVAPVNGDPRYTVETVFRGGVS